MKNKINSYVSYVFNTNNIKDEEMFDEITANLNDRYNSYIEEGIDSETAYIKTINTLGDFNLNKLEIKETYNYRANWANISLWVSLGLSILGTIVLLLNTTMSILFVGLSISLYIASAYYLYHSSQYSLKVLKDVEKHNELLKGIFKNLKTNFIFWNINISFWITSILGNLVFLLMSYGLINNTLDVEMLMWTYGIIFVVIFIIVLLIFNNIYIIIEKKYFELTQEDKLESYISNKSNFYINRKATNVILKIISIVGILIYMGVIYTAGVHVSSGEFSMINYSEISLNNNRFNNNVFDVFITFFLVISSLITVISIIFNKKKLSRIGMILLVVMHVITVSFLLIGFKSSLNNYYNNEVLSINFLNILAIFVMTLVIIANFIFVKLKNKE